MTNTETLACGRALGEEFLTWLWMRGNRDGGTSGHDGDETAVFLDGSVTLASETGDVQNLALSKGNPAESRAAFEALSRGMRPTKGKIRILDGDMEWVCLITSDTLDTGSMKLPKTDTREPTGRMADRLFLIEQGLSHLERRYGRFLRIRDEGQDSLEEEIQDWIRSGLESQG